MSMSHLAAALRTQALTAGRRAFAEYVAEHPGATLDDWSAHIDRERAELLARWQAGRRP